MKVLRSPEGKYLRGKKATLREMQPWIKATKPSFQQIKEALLYMQEHFPDVDDISAADIFLFSEKDGVEAEKWEQQELNELRCYFPTYKLVPVYLYTRPL